MANINRRPIENYQDLGCPNLVDFGASTTMALITSMSMFTKQQIPCVKSET